MRAFKPGSENAYTYHEEEEHIDSQAEVKVYRLNPDGSKGEFLRVEPAYPPGWDDPAKRKQVPNYKDLKGEDTMAIDWKRVWPQVQRLQAQGKSVTDIATELGIEQNTLRSKIYREEKKQTPTPEPAAAANQEPERETTKSAENSIPYSVERLENIGREINPDDDTKIYTPERQNYTITQYNEQVKQGGFTAADEEPIPYQLVTYDSYGHHDVAEEIACLLDRKRQDYGVDNIKKFGSLGCLIRTSDKVERLINLKHRKAANFETLEDSWRDIAGYAILALIELKEGR